MTAVPEPEDRLDPVARVFALAAVALGLYLYLGRLDGTPLQRGSEAMYAFPPIQMLESGDYLVTRYQNQNYLDKPSLTLWIIAASYRLLGVSVFAARLPAAIAGLLTILILGLWVRRRCGIRSGLLAALILMFSFEFAFTAMTFAADAFLTLGVMAAVLALEESCRRQDGSDIAWGTLCGSALALAFSFKGLVGVVLPIGAVSASCLLDRQRPVRPWRRGGWALLTLVVLLAPWHWAMTNRLGAEFWRVFYWQNQFLRGSTLLYISARHGPFYYLGVLAWAVFPWSLLLPGALRRRRPTSLPLGWLLFGLLFWSLLVMKREVYLIPLLPAAAALIAEGFADGDRLARTWQRFALVLAAMTVAAMLVPWARGLRSLAGLAGPSAAVFLGVAALCLTAALWAVVLAPRNVRTLFGAALACGVLCLAVRILEERLARFDPLPAWGERVRRECGQGCDGFLIGLSATSLDFYSRVDWIGLKNVQQIPERMRHRKSYVVLVTRLEPRLAGLPLHWEVVDRRATFGSYSPKLLSENWTDSLQSLSLVRIEASP